MMDNGIKIYVAFSLATAVVSWWNLFIKLGIPAWKSIIPVYNLLCLTQKIQLKPHWALLGSIPIVGVPFLFYIALACMKHLNISQRALFFALLLIFPVAILFLMAFNPHYVLEDRNEC